MKKFFPFFLALAFLFPCFIHSQSNGTQKPVPVIEKNKIPEIPDLESRDAVFKQYALDVQQFYMDFAAGKKFTVNFYSYTVKESDTIFSISARCNIPYETIACINGISTSDFAIAGKVLVIPSAAGIFVLDGGTLRKETAGNSFEMLIQKKYGNSLNEEEHFCYNINGRYFFYFPGERLDQTTRAFFLDAKMRPPLDNYWLSSGYGYRQNPFGGSPHFHRGIDMAAAEGTPVYACKSGKVTSVVRLDKTFGNYITIKHANGLSSIYAHLSKIEVAPNDTVETGQEIGLVGKTGKVTGPHLHFEIRQNGQPTDPNAYIKR